MERLHLEPSIELKKSVLQIALICLQDPDILYDDNAFTITAIYQDGILRLYAHAPIKSTDYGGLMEYRMTFIDKYCIGESANSF